MTDHPLVSVVLPTFNRAALLPRAIASVLSQTYSNLELIVVDDASTDQTAELMGAYDDSRIRYLPLEQNLGAAAARNRGIEAAAGSLVAFQDSDDVWDSSKLEWHAGVMKGDPDIAASVCSFDFHKGGRRMPIRHTERAIAGDDVALYLLTGVSVPTATLAARRTALLAVNGFDEALPRRQDLDLSLRLAREHRFYFGAFPLVDNYASPDSISTDPFKYVEATERLLQTHRDVFERLPAAHAFQMYNVAKHLAFTGHRQEALPYAQRAVTLNHEHTKARILLFGLRTRTLPLLRMFAR